MKQAEQKYQIVVLQQCITWDNITITITIVIIR